MAIIEVDCDENIAKLIEEMANAEGTTPEDISKNALQEYLKKFTQRCITTDNVTHP